MEKFLGTTYDAMINVINLVLSNQLISLGRHIRITLRPSKFTDGVLSHVKNYVSIRRFL